MNRAEVVERYGCPRCHAAAGTPCTGRGGAERTSCHAARWPSRALEAAAAATIARNRRPPALPAPLPTLTDDERRRGAELAREARDRLRVERNGRTT